MSYTSTLLQQFRSFCFQNSLNDIEIAIEYFAVFGGMGWSVDSTTAIESLIKTKVLDNYRYIHDDITSITNNQHHKLLSALALGNQQEHSAFRKIGLSREKGESAVDFLLDKDILTLQNSIEPPFDKEEIVSDKLYFNRPFIRFWFSFISPYYKGIKEGDYREFEMIWGHNKQTFSNFIYQQLTMELIKLQRDEDKIERIGDYWDKRVEIDIVAKYQSGRRMAGACHFAKSKATKKELSKLQQKADTAKLEIDEFVIFSKSKFSTELKKEKNSGVKLLTPKSLAPLIANLSKKDLMRIEGKRY